jgi:molybdopterin-guanine dinucleotide biosynthesis protein A
MAYLDTDYVLMCPCDSPFIQSALISDLINEGIAADAEIAVAHDGERLQPVFCMAHSRLRESLDTFLDAGERKIDRWFLQHSLLEVDARKYTRSFRNINTEKERISAEKELLS